MTMEELPLGAIRVRSWSRGCALCWKGAKLVLFVTGKCPLYDRCPYCTISNWRRGKDLVVVNELTVHEDEEILKEAELISALGAGITGGEPSLVPEKVAHYTRLLKERFGNQFHIHMYTNAIGINERSLDMLADAGLDEIRFHTWDKRLWSRITLASDMGFVVGAEMPAIPGQGWVKALEELASFLDRIGASFMNLNELEFTPSNRQKLLSMDFMPREDSDVAVYGSREAAIEVLEFIERETSISGYFCPAAQKEYQVRMRWARRACNVARSYEMPTDEGTLIFGEIKGPPEVLKDLVARYGGYLEGGRLLIDVYKFHEIANQLRSMGLEARLLEVMPTDDRRILQVYPLDYVIREDRRHERD